MNEIHVIKNVAYIHYLVLFFYFVLLHSST